MLDCYRCNKNINTQNDIYFANDKSFCSIHCRHMYLENVDENCILCENVQTNVTDTAPKYSITTLCYRMISSLINVLCFMLYVF